MKNQNLFFTNFAKNSFLKKKRRRKNKDKERLKKRKIQRDITSLQVRGKALCFD